MTPFGPVNDPRRCRDGEEQLGASVKDRHQQVELRPEELLLGELLSVLLDESHLTNIQTAAAGAVAVQDIQVSKAVFEALAH